MAKPPCVLFLLDWRPVFWSTREEYFRQLCAKLTEHGVVPVLTVSESVDEATRQRFEQAGARLAARSYHSGPWAYAKHLREVTRNYDVRIAHVRFFDYFTTLFRVCRWCGVRTILFTEANGGEWSNRGWRRALIRARTRWMCAPLTKAIAISGFIQRRLIAVGIPRERTAVIYNGVDLAHFQRSASLREAARAEDGLRENTVTLMFASAMLPSKRPEIALRVCAVLAQRDIDVRLWMAGDGPLRPAMEELARKLNIATRVRWLGHTSEMSRWYCGADFFLHPSLGEAFGNVLIEAMACGLPVIASASGGIPELVIHGETGLLFPPGPGETQEMANSVAALAADRTRHSQMSEAAVLQAQRFPIERSVADTWELYEPFLRSEPGDRRITAPA